MTTRYVPRWHPAISDMTEGYAHLPEIGALIAVDRKPWRVLAIDPVHPANWQDHETAYWHECGTPDPWERQPVRVLAEPAQGGPRVGLRVGPCNYDWFDLLPGHYAICAVCSEMAPCRHLTAELDAKEAMNDQERQDGKLMPGCCPGCGDVITRKQRAVAFPGENLLSPLAHQSPAFHLRARCRWSAEGYEELWVAADPARARSMLTLRCEGSLVTHHVGDAECSEPACPGAAAKHGRMSACCGIYESPCPRGCGRTGHPGARQAKPTEYGLRGEPIR